MKKAYICIFLIGVAFAVAACSSAPAEKTNPFVDRFSCYRVDNKATVIVDDETGVCYLWRGEGYRGGLTVMLKSDGSPMIYKEE